MANIIKIKRSTTAGNTPSLVDGELALNQADMKLFSKNSAGVTKFLDFTSDAEKVAAGAIKNALDNKANATNPLFSGTITTSSASDSIVQFETTATDTTTFRRKQLYSSPNVGGGNDWLFRSLRPSDNAVQDYFLRSGHGGDILTTGNTDADYIAFTSRAPYMITGGGTLSVSSTNRVKWTTRFMVISSGRGGGKPPADGYYGFNFPAVNTVITGYGGVANDTVTADGILLNSWNVLYAVPTLGGTEQQYSYALVSYTGTFTIPRHWIPIIRRNDDSGAKFHFPGGFVLNAGEVVSGFDRYYERTSPLIISSAANGGGNLNLNSTSGDGNRLAFSSAGTQKWQIFTSATQFNIYSFQQSKNVLAITSTDITIDNPLSLTNTLNFGTRTGQLLNLYSNTYALGIQGGTLYARTGGEFAVHIAGSHSDTLGDPGTGGTNLLRANNTFFTYKGSKVATEAAANGFSARNQFLQPILVDRGQRNGNVTDLNSDGSIKTRIHSGFWQNEQSSTALGYPSTGWHNIITATHQNEGNYFSLQIAAGFFQNSDFYIRSTGNVGDIQWNKLWHNNNFNPDNKLNVNDPYAVGDVLVSSRTNGAYGGVRFLDNSTGNVDFDISPTGYGNTREAAIRYNAETMLTFKRDKTTYFAKRPTWDNSVPWDNKNLYVIQPGAFGTVGNGGADDYPALQALINSMSHGSTIIFTSGVYRLSQALLIEEKTICIMGAASGGVIFLCDTHGIYFKTGSLLPRLHVENIIFQRSNANSTLTGYNAIQIDRPLNLSSSTEPGPVIRGCSFWGIRTGNGGSQPGYTTGWSIGILMNAGWNSIVENNFFRGRDQAYDSTFLYATDHSTPIIFFKNMITFAERGVYFTSGSFAEGLSAYGNQFVAVLDGIYLDNGTSAPLAQIYGNHINAARYAIRCVARPQIMIGDNLIYNWNLQGAGQGAGGYNFVGIQIEGGCYDSEIRSNKIFGFKDNSAVTGNSIGIVAEIVDGSMIHDNSLINLKTGFDGTNKYKGTFYNNIVSYCTNRFVGGTGSTKIWNNWDYTDSNNPVAL